LTASNGLADRCASSFDRIGCLNGGNGSKRIAHRRSSEARMANINQSFRTFFTMKRSSKLSVSQSVSRRKKDTTPEAVSRFQKKGSARSVLSAFDRRLIFLSFEQSSYFPVYSSRIGELYHTCKMGDTEIFKSQRAVPHTPESSSPLHFQGLHAFHGLRPCSRGSACPFQAFLTMWQDSLHVTAC